MTVVVRPARAADVPALLEVVTAAYRDRSGTGWTTEAELIDGGRTDAEELTAMLPDLLVGDDGTGVVGCCALTRRDGRGHFGMFAVRPSLQGAGVGAQLLAAAEARARALGLREVEMTVLPMRAELVAYYERRGYARTGETRPFPYGVTRNGVPRSDDLEFAVLLKDLDTAP